MFFHPDNSAGCNNVEKSIARHYWKLMISQPQLDSLLIRDPAFKLRSSLPKPEFMLIGSAKCGTTSFASYLCAHPQVKKCTPKEPNFWSWKMCSKDQYQQLFVNAVPRDKPASGQNIGGEYSTSSIIHPLVPRRVRARLPDVKLLVLLRNPVERAYSHYLMVERTGSEGECSFDRIVEREIHEVPKLLAAHKRGFMDGNFRTAAHRCSADGQPLRVATHDKKGSHYSLFSDEDLFKFYVTSYVFRSVYCDQLWRWLQIFPREQFLFIESQRLLNQRKTVLNEVVNFLGMQPYDFPLDQIQHTLAGGGNLQRRPGDYEAMNPKTRIQLAHFFEPFNEKLFDLIGERYDWN